MSSTKYPVHQVYNMSLCEKYPEEYKLCPEDGSCRLYGDLCATRTETVRVKIETAVIVSAVLLCFVIFIVASVIHRIRRAKRQSDDDHADEEMSARQKHQVTRLTPTASETAETAGHKLRHTNISVT